MYVDMSVYVLIISNHHISFEGTVVYFQPYNYSNSIESVRIKVGHGPPMFARQMRLARLVIGAHGGALANIMFTPLDAGPHGGRVEALEDPLEGSCPTIHDLNPQP